MKYFAPIALVVSVLLALPAPASAQQAASSSTQIKAEAYYYFCLGRLDERNARIESAIDNYDRAAELDPEAGYPHVALAELYDKLRRTELALQKAKRAIELDPDIAAAHRILGRTYFSMLRNGAAGEVEQLAVQAFQETVRLEPGDVESRSNLARLLIVTRRADEATVHLEEIVRLVPSAYYEMFLLAKVRQAEGETEAAIGLLKQSLAVEPRQAEAREMLLPLLMAEQRYREIADVYQGAVELVPGDLDSRIRLADALANDGQLEAAAREFQVILQEDPKNVFALIGLGMVRRDLMELAEAERLLRQALAMQPTHVLGQYTLAGVYEQKRAFEQAAAEWMKLIELPDESAEAPQRKAEYWAHLGFAHEQLGRLDKSVAAFAKARELSDGDERFETFYIQGLLAAEQPDEALRAIEEVLETNPDVDRFKILKARALDSRGDHDKAVEMVLELSAQSPDDERLAQGVIEIYLQQKRYADTEVFIRRRLVETPDSVNLRFQLAAALERQKKFDEAEAQFEKILETEPDSASALNYLGYMLADQDRRLEESLEYVKRAVAQDPYNGAYLDSLGWVYFKMGELDLAEESLLKAIDSLRLTGVVYDHLGDLYFRKGNREQAIEFWRKALEQDDDELEKNEVAPEDRTGYVDPVTLRRLVLVAALVVPSCRRPPPELPPPSPVDTAEIRTRLGELAGNAESVRRYQGFVRIRGRGPEGSFSGRLVVVFERPDRLRVDLLGAFGSTRWSAVANQTGITVVFPGPKQYVREEDTADVVGRLLGVRLSSHEVMALLAGVGIPLGLTEGPDVNVSDAFRQGSVTVAQLQGLGRLELDDGQIVLVQTSRYRVSYPTPWQRRQRHVPDTIQLETEAMRATLTPEDVDVNVALAPEAFAVEIPEAAERLRPSDVAGEAVFVVTKESR